MRTTFTRRVATLLLAGVLGPALAAEPIVSTDAGRVQGQVESGLAVFRGIRYAAPPVGDGRWREPRPAVPWPGVQPARATGASCIQKTSLSVDSGGGDPSPISEDCLFINVWTPDAGPTTTGCSCINVPAHQPCVTSRVEQGFHVRPLFSVRNIPLGLPPLVSPNA